MPHLQVKNVPPALYEELRRRATQRRVTIRDYVLALIESDQRLPTTDDWLAEIRERGPLTDVPIDAAAAVRAGREEREAHLNAWVDDRYGSGPGDRGPG